MDNTSVPPTPPEAGLVGRGLKGKLVVDVGYQVTEGLCFFLITQRQKLCSLQTI